MKNKGITLISLVITIVVLLILAFSSVTISTNILSYTNLQTIRTNMLQIQAKAKMAEEKANFQKDENLLVGIKIDEITDNPKIQDLFNKEIIKQDEEYYMLSKQDLERWDLIDVQIDDGYLVNYKTDEVIYVKGVKGKQDNLYYKLTDIMEQN